MHSGKTKIIASIIATSIVAPAAYSISYADENNIQVKNVEYRMITGNSVNVRTGPGTNYSSIMKLNKGDKVEYIATNGNWINIKYNGKIGYVYSDYVSKISNSTSTETNDNSVKCTKVVTGNSVNVRRGPSISYSSITKLSKEVELGYISESNVWSKISYNGTIGYMSSQYLKEKSSAPSTSTETSDNSVKCTKVVTGNSVNVRRGPSTSYSAITSLSKGVKVGYISESNGWSKINYNGIIGYMSSKYLGDKVSSDTQTSNKSEKVVSLAKSLLGKPYVWGAEGPNSFDCSGYVQYVFKQSVGISVPRVSKEQSKYGQFVNRSDLQVGDIVCFDTEDSNNGNVSHSGIYIGNGEFIHASSAKGKVIISNMSSGFYNNAYVNARRVL